MSPSNTHGLSFRWNDLSLSGTLALPAGARSDDESRYPAALLLQGSGPADRDSGDYFAAIRQAFLDRGIATYSFDKPGCGESTGDWRDYGIEARLSQATVAVKAVATNLEIDAQRVGVFGHSQGGWIVQQLAGRVDDLAFAIANSAPTIDVEAQNIYAHARKMRDEGRDQVEINDARTFLMAMHEAARADQTFTTVKQTLIAAAETKPWFDYFTIDDEQDWRHMQILLTEPLDPVAALSAVRCPFLATYGGLDALVPPWRGAKETGKALHLAPSSDAAVMVFPDGDHRMQDLGTGDFIPGYLDTIGDWAAQRV